MNVSSDEVLEKSAKMNFEENIENVLDFKEKLDAQDTMVQEERGQIPTELDIHFKKPILPKCTLHKMSSATHTHSSETVTLNETQNVFKSTDKQFKTSDCKLQKDHRVISSKDISLAYKEPPWGGTPEREYKLEVLKSGVILETIDLTKKSFHIVGRLPFCDVSLAHPTISRYHAIFQYRSTESEGDTKGLYLYDLESTHGTFWNGSRIKSNLYVRLHGGHIIRFGCSQRKYILQAPSDDLEEESTFSLTELREKRKLELQDRACTEDFTFSPLGKRNFENTENGEAGIDWGMGEDADEETDLTENPYASGVNEELYLDDPKKTLRGWFEREGFELQYKTEEKGIGQFLCWIDLPIDGVTGGSIRAEALVRGKKKECVIQCALEACRVLDRHGLLRQANHEARKKKVKNWEEQDYYDSDEDNFLDRTGSIEKKREQRMRLAGKLEEKVETYDSLLERHREVTKQIFHLSNSVKSSQQRTNWEAENGNEDALDAYMSTLSSSVLSKSDVIKIKLELQSLRKEEERLVKLVNLTRPANLPPIVSHSPFATDKEDQRNALKSKRTLGNVIINIGQRRKAMQKRVIDKMNDAVATITSTQDKKQNHEHESEDDDMDMTDGSASIGKWTINSEEINVLPQDSSHKLSDGSTKEIDEIQRISSRNLEVREKKRKEICGDGDNSDKKTKYYGKRNANAEWEMQNVKALKMVCDQNKDGEDGYYYSTWVPLENQSGDGKTSLNDKYGY